MMSTRADRHLCAIRLAQDCAQLGARVRTIHHLTGLNPRDVQRLFFNDPQAIPRGRPPNSLEWYHGANLIARAESSIFMSMYRRLRNTGFGAAETLVSAYRGYKPSASVRTASVLTERLIWHRTPTESGWPARLCSMSSRARPAAAMC